jgi:hypothetical protein
MDKLISGDLTHVVSNATSVRFRAFSDYTRLVSVDLPMATQCNNYAFNACTNLSDVQIPLLSHIPIFAFYSCNALTKLDLFSTTYIDGLALANTGLNTLILRTNIVVTLGAANAFSGTTFITVYVPEALIESYQTATNWATLYAEGRCNFVAIEGSEYE